MKRRETVDAYVRAVGAAMHWHRQMAGLARTRAEPFWSGMCIALGVASGGVANVCLGLEPAASAGLVVGGLTAAAIFVSAAWGCLRLRDEHERCRSSYRNVLLRRNLATPWHADTALLCAVAADRWAGDGERWFEEAKP